MAFDGMKNGVKKFFGADGNNDEQDNVVAAEVTDEDAYYDVSKESATGPNMGSNKMILFEPRAYSEATQITDFLKKRNTVVVNLKRVTPDQAKRIADFLQGSLYAIKGSLQKLGGGIFLCAPNNVNIEGKITDESSKPSKSNKKEDSKDEEEFSW